MIDRLPWPPRLRTSAGWLEIGRGGLGALLGLLATGIVARAVIGGGP